MASLASREDHLHHTKLTKAVTTVVGEHSKLTKAVTTVVGEHSKLTKAVATVVSAVLHAAALRRVK